MKQPIIAFDQDTAGDWRAELACGHFQHVRHNPPMISRPWIASAAGRAEKIGMELDCLRCDGHNASDAEAVARPESERKEAGSPT